MNPNRFALFLLMALAVWPAGMLAQSEPAALPSVIYTKEFPGSTPAYYSISLRQDGAALYRTAPGEEPVAFQLSTEFTGQIFALARKLSMFRGIQVESGRKVAQMGKKTFAYQDETERSEVSFNHTENPDALALQGLFERLSQTQQHRERLEYLLRFDRLGVVKELLQLEIDFDQGQLLEPSLLEPILEKVRTNKALVNVAQERATRILSKLQAGSK